LKKKYFGDFFALQFNSGSFGHCRIQLLTENFIHYFLSVEGRKEKSLFISGSFFSFSDFEIEVLHREVDGSFAEMKVCRVGHRNCFLHSFLSEKINEKYGI
jgi:hypothetical protein